MSSCIHVLQAKACKRSQRPESFKSSRISWDVELLKYEHVWMILFPVKVSGIVEVA